MGIEKDAELLHEIILSMQRKIRAKLHNELSSGEISIPQFHILSYLLEKKATIMVELAKYLEVSASAITGLVDNLVRMGLVKRKFSPSDRRVIIASLTDKGKKVVTRIKDQFRNFLEEILKKFSPEERKKLLELSDKMEKFL